MTRLVAVELRRLLARRLTRVAAVALLLLVGLALYGTQQQIWSQTPERVAQLQQESLRSCLDAQAEVRSHGGTVDFPCAQAGAKDPGATRSGVVDVARSTVTSLAYLLAFLAFLVGATFVAAELSTGAIGTWLTYEPRRGRVYASKLAALLVGVWCVSALALVVVAAATVVLGDHYGLEVAPAGAGGGPLWGDAGRTLLLVGGAGLAGAAVATVLRSTAAALGLLVGYLVVVEGLLQGALRYGFGEVRPWLLVPNATAWLQGGLLDDQVSLGCVDPAGGCGPPGELISTAHAGLYLLGLTAAAVLIATVTFRRRDIA